MPPDTKTNQQHSKSRGRRLRSVVLLMCPFLLWAGLVNLRPSFMSLRCVVQPAACSPESIFWLDHFSLGLDVPRADEISFIAQNTMGILALALPFATALFLGRTSRCDWASARTALRADLRLLLLTVGWNGVLTESVRDLVQRPRPFVYADPRTLGANPAHYTSFFSGHTSFVTAVGAASILLLMRRRASREVVVGAVFLVTLFIFMTALGRVLSGRHFPSDVIGAVIGGATVAYCINRFCCYFQPSNAEVLP